MLRTFIRWLESGEKTPRDLVEICLARIRELDADIHAWVEVSPQRFSGHGPLRGIPFGVKDIFETRGMATEFGSPLYAGRIGETDSALVTDLRRRGAILLGKTHTTAFAYFDAAPTRNPRDPRRTPGGSSSGSAAAVAAGMVPFALGTQTQGSIVRPASYCGVVGFKPTFGVLPLEGVLPFAPSLDTAGFFTQTVDDMLLLWGRGVVGQADTGWKACATGAEPQMQAAFEQTLDRLRRVGMRLQPVELPDLLPAVRIVNAYEGARTHRHRWEQHGARIGAKLAQLVEEGLRIESEEYQAALDRIRAARQEMARVFEDSPVILTPAAPGPAPEGLESTGDPRMNSPWTALGTPALSLPMSVSGPPLGLQLTAAPGDDARLLSAAAHVERLLSLS